MHSCFTTFQNMYMYTRLTGHSWIDHVPILFASPHQWTPLRQAAEGGHVDTVYYLVEKGANIHSKDSNGVSEWECTTDCRLVLLIRVSLVPMHLTRVWYALVQLITSILSEIEITNWSAWKSDKQIQLVHLLICTTSVTTYTTISQSLYEGV